MPKKRKKTITVSSYDPWITVKKFFTGLFMTLIPVILAYTAEFLQNEEFPPEYAVFIPLVVAIIHATINYIKHRNDTEEVEY